MIEALGSTKFSQKFARAKRFVQLIEIDSIKSFDEIVPSLEWAIKLLLLERKKKRISFNHDLTLSAGKSLNEIELIQFLDKM